MGFCETGRDTIQANFYLVSEFAKENQPKAIIVSFKSDENVLREGRCKIVKIFRNGDIITSHFIKHKKEKDGKIFGKFKFLNHPDLAGFCVFFDNFKTLHHVEFELFMFDFLYDVKKKNSQTPSEQFSKVIDDLIVDLNNPYGRLLSKVSLSLSQQIIANFARDDECRRIHQDKQFDGFDIFECKKGNVNDQLIDRIKLVRWCGCQFRRTIRPRLTKLSLTHLKLSLTDCFPNFDDEMY